MAGGSVRQNSRGRSQRGRGGMKRNTWRAPFKKSNHSSSYNQCSAQKRKSDDFHHTHKKFKDAVEDIMEDPSSSSDSEPEVDSHYLLLQSFGVSGDASSDSEEDEDAEEEVDDSEGTVGSEEDEIDEDGDDVTKNRNANDQEYLSDVQDHDNDVSPNSDSDGNVSNDEESNSDILSEYSDCDSTEDTRRKTKSKEKVMKDVPLGEDFTELDVDGEELLKDKDDPFSCHFEHCLREQSSEWLQDPSHWLVHCSHWPGLGRVKQKYPMQQKVKQEVRQRLLLQDRQHLQEPVFGREVNPLNVDKLNSRYIKQNIEKNVGEFNDLQKQLMSIIANYTDLYYPEATFDKWDDITKIYCIHTANHILKTRARILRNNSKLNKAKLANIEIDMSQFQDQGFARPKVLILLPSRHSAYRVVQCLASLLQLKGSEDVLHQRRFESEFGPGHDPTSGSAALPRSKRNRPPDYLATFAGDTSEDFKIGITLNKKSMRLYTSFYSSDIILASPLGLRLTTGVEGEEENNTGFLTSVEVLIMDQADMFLMQNWEHVQTVWENINLPVQSMSDIVCDSRRVRPWLVDGHAQLYRQTIMFSASLQDAQRAMFAKTTNFAGKIEVLPSLCMGAVAQVHTAASLLLLRCPGTNDAEERFSYFVKEFLPHHVTSRKAHTLLFIPDYHDYYNINHYLSKERAFAFSSINEYMTQKMSHVAVARSDFFKGTSAMLLYTERFHFYKRPVIKGIRHLVFYSLPVNSHFFSELCNMMMTSNQNRAISKEQKLLRPSVTVFYQTSDVTKLAAVMGSKNATELLATDKAVHMCSIGGR